MYELITNKTKLYFMNESDYNNYKDYLNNGLKCISKKGSTYIFNNGDRLLKLDTTCILYRSNKKLTNIKYYKKHLAIIKGD